MSNFVTRYLYAGPFRWGDFLPLAQGAWAEGRSDRPITVKTGKKKIDAKIGEKDGDKSDNG